MKTFFLVLIAGAAGLPRADADLSPAQVALLPAPASHPIEFSRDIKPILEASCVKCHARGRDRGGLSIETPDAFLAGGDSGPAVETGHSSTSYLIELVSGLNPDLVMPEKGTRLTPAQVGLLRAWIDQGAKWDKGITFARPPPNNLKIRRPDLPPGALGMNPIDRLLRPYFAAHGIRPVKPVTDRVFARRVYLDVVGLLPSPSELAAFLADSDPAKREKLVDRLLADSSGYAQHWISFWNDLLRNDYGGAGNRKGITPWLYRALATNLPYNQFVAELADPTPETAGFVQGILWRGTINASETPQMQAAQNISQVFMGVNLKCASCHDSFVNDLTLADAYGMAGIYSDGPLEMVRCDKPMGKKAALKFLYPELGQIDPQADKEDRIRQFVKIMTQRSDGRLTRTIVNRYWDRLLGRGLVETVDDMEKFSWDPDLLDWLAEDFADHGYDLRRLLRQILTSRAYQLPAIAVSEKDNAAPFVFRGPLVRRMTAEQFVDAVGQLTGAWYDRPSVVIDLGLGVGDRPAVPDSLHRIGAAAGRSPSSDALYFSKTVELAEPAKEAFLLMGHVPGAVVKIDGKEIGKKRIIAYGDVDFADLRGSLHPGQNQILVKTVPSLDQPSAQELAVYARLGEEGSKTSAATVATDASWVCAFGSRMEADAANLARAQWNPVRDLGEMASSRPSLAASFQAALATTAQFGRVRASLVQSTSLQEALARPGRDQVSTTRSSVATTFQALEFSNGQELAERLRRGAENLLATDGASTPKLVRDIYLRGLGRLPQRDEMKLALGSMGNPASPTGTEDFLWAVTMSPEFQIIF